MIILNTSENTSLYKQLYKQIKQKIISGDYPKGTRLPSTRKLAMDLCVGRNTVESAYDQLCVEGYVESRQGSGFTVMDLTKDLLQFPCMLDGGVIDRQVHPQNDRQNVPHNGQVKSDYRYSFR